MGYCWLVGESNSALAAVIDSRDLVIVGHTSLGTCIGVVRHRHRAQQTVAAALRGGTIDLVGGRTGYGVPHQLRLPTGGGVADLDNRRRRLRCHGLDLPADDPVYTGKAFAGLVKMAREGQFKPTDNVLYLYSGGAGGLFAIDVDLD